MKKEDRLNLLLKDLHSMSTEELVKDYNKKNIKVIGINKRGKGKIIFK